MDWADRAVRAAYVETLKVRDGGGMPELFEAMAALLRTEREAARKKCDDSAFHWLGKALSTSDEAQSGEFRAMAKAARILASEIHPIEPMPD